MTHVSRAPNKLFSGLLAAALLISAAATTPETVWCVGPGHHCHVETILGFSCNDQLSEHGIATPRLPDGCPKGSKDFRLSVDTHRSDHGSLVGTRALQVRISAAPDKPSVFSRTHAPVPWFAMPCQSPPNVVLRY